MISLPPEFIKKAKVLGSNVRYADLKPEISKDPDTAIVFLAGQKSPLERFFPFSEYFAQFYRTYNYEIPGMGLQSRAPDNPATIHNMSLELAEFIKNVVEEKKIIIVAGSVGFWFTTEALLHTKEIRKRVVKIIALVGLLGRKTFGFSGVKRRILLTICKLFQTKTANKLITKFLKNDRLVRIYAKHLIKKRHLSHLPETLQKEYEAFEIFLLQIGDWRIHFSTIEQYLTTDVSSNEKIDIPLFSLFTPHDQFFPVENQRRTFAETYTDVVWEPIHLKQHAPLIVKDYHEYKDIIPEEKILAFLDK